MPLPDLIEIVPLDQPVHAEITVPGSKSITNRALILAALAAGKVTLQGALWSEDTQVMVDCLHRLGFAVDVQPDADEFCNRTITVQGLGGRIPNGGTVDKPLELFVGNAGTAARFLAAMVCLGAGVYRLHGVPRMYERPQAALFAALRELGYRIDTPNDKLPAVIHGGGSAFPCRSRGDETHSQPGNTERGMRSEDQSLLTSAPTGKKRCAVSIAESSQFASALLLSAKAGGWEVKIEGENAEESPYVEMTKKMIKVFPHSSGTFQIEPDASSGSYFWAAGGLLHRTLLDVALWVAKRKLGRELRSGESLPLKEFQPTRITVALWPTSGWQIDADYTSIISGGIGLPQEISRRHDLGDSIMTAVTIAPVHTIPIRFTDLGRLRVQECERVVALRTELTKCGAKVIEEGDTLTVYPSPLHGAEIETYNDHRMAMCFAILGLKVPGIKIKNPACVKKTFPNFFQKLASAPPRGLGATILDPATGRALGVDELFAA